MVGIDVVGGEGDARLDPGRLPLRSRLDEGDRGRGAWTAPLPPSDCRRRRERRCASRIRACRGRTRIARSWSADGDHHRAHLADVGSGLGCLGHLDPIAGGWFHKLRPASPTKPSVHPRGPAFARLIDEDDDAVFAHGLRAGLAAGAFFPLVSPNRRLPFPSTTGKTISRCSSTRPLLDQRLHQLSSCRQPGYRLRLACAFSFAPPPSQRPPAAGSSCIQSALRAASTRRRTWAWRSSCRRSRRRPSGQAAANAS